MFKRSLTLIAVLALATAPARAQAGRGASGKLDSPLRARAETGGEPPGSSSKPPTQAQTDRLIRSLHGTPGRRLGLLGSQVAEIPNTALEALASRPGVSAIRLDRPVQGTMERTAATIGAKWVRENLGFDGAGVGVAIIDSGVTSWHDDLGSDRVVHFADFVDFQPQPYDDYGHGTHVAGIIAGSGYDSNGARRGIAPAANLVVLKVLDGDGFGYISNVIAALDYAVEHRAQYNIRVINLSVAAGVYESYTTDPLTLAAKRAVEAGVVVVTAAGNLGRNAQGQPQYGGITAPGNAPWVLTVGASSHNGTMSRADDSIAPFSSRGPSFIDYSAKPDLVAPGVGIESLADASSLLYRHARHGATLGHGGHRDAALSQPHRHQHVCACGQRHHRAHDAGESVADAESRQGDPAIHRGTQGPIQRDDAGRRFPERAGSRAGREIARGIRLRCGGAADFRSHAVEQTHQLGQSPHWRRSAPARRQRVAAGCDMGSFEHH